MIDPTLTERFLAPPSNYGPTPLWWWSGGTVTEEGIDRQLADFVAGGVRDVVLINLAPSGPTYGVMPDDPVWFSERWWELFRHTCDRARETGVHLWFYDQFGFSGANLQGSIRADDEELGGRSLRSSVLTAGRDGRLVLDPRDHVIGVYRIDSLGDHGWEPLRLDGDRADGITEGEQVRVVAWRATAFDYLSPVAVERLIDTVHGELERRVPDHIGSTLVGTFQDEMAPMPTWSDAFAERFHEMHGYRIESWMPALWERGSDRAARVRTDYHRTRTALAEEAFFRPLADWHRERGMHIGADQQNPARAGFPTQGVQLYGDYFATHRWFDAVGSDHQGDARIHSSMADLYDHARVWVEAFHSTGWGGTLEEIWDWLIPFFRSGGDLYNPHASYFNLAAGWFEWAPPSTDARQPYWAVHADFARAVARVASLSGWGRHAVDVAVLYPSEAVAAELAPDMWVDHFGTTGELGTGFEAADEAQRTYFALVGKNDFFDPRPGSLDTSGIDFDAIDGDSLAAAAVAGGALWANGFEFKVVILPRMVRIRPDVARRLVELLDGGGRVIVVGAPPTAAIGTGPLGPNSLPADAEAIDQLARHDRLEIVESAEDAASAAGAGIRPIRASTGARARVSGDTGVAILPMAFPNATRRREGLKAGSDLGEFIQVDFDAARYEDSATLEIAGRVAEAEVWNPATGERRPIDVAIAEDRSVVVVPADGSPLLVVAWRVGEEAPNASLATPPESRAEEEALDLEWTQELVPTLDNHAGDFALPASDTPLPLEAWTIALSHDDVLEEVRVGFGQEVLLLPPSPPHAVAPLDPAAAAAAIEGGSLGDEQWRLQRYSSWQGAPGTATVNLRGFVEEEFIVHQAPAAGEEVGLRTLVRVPEPGTYDLTVSAPVRAEIWVDGRELSSVGRGRDTTVRATFASRVAVLEYRLRAPESPEVNPLGLLVWSSASPVPDTFGVSFTIQRQGTRIPIPEFMTPGPEGVTGRVARFRHTFTSESDARGRIVTGATCALRVLLDGKPVAGQERVQYYEDGIGGTPTYFAHDIGEVAAGEHVLEVHAMDADEDSPVFVDLVLKGEETLVVVSGPEWTVGERSAPVALNPGLSTATGHARVARRAHPLAPSEWLTGGPEIGESAVPFECAVSMTPREDIVEIELPAGTTEVGLASEPLSATIDGEAVEVSRTAVILRTPLDQPRTLRAIMPGRTFSAGAARWNGPITIKTSQAPARFEDWRSQGLRSWSGAIRYTTVVELDNPASLRLDLGSVRGAVMFDIDGEPAGSAFCRPFRVDIGELSPGQHTISATVYGTLGPRYAESTPSVFVTPPQRSTGVFGPVRVTSRAAG